MPKTIKFNLICDNNPIRTIDDLRNNFSIEDVLSYFENKLLHKWLSVRGYVDQLEKVEKVNSNDPLVIVNELINIFEVETDAEKIKENTYVLKYKVERELLLEEYKKMDFNANSILDDYHAGYQELIDTILDNKDDMAKIKAALKELIASYSKLIAYDYRRLFYTFIFDAPKAVFAMLMTDLFRSYYLPSENENATSTEMNSDSERIYRKVCESIVNESKLVEVLGDDLKTFAGNTEAYWKDVESKGNKYMVVKMENGNFIRNAGVNGGDLSNTEIQNKFVILDGIDYKSNNTTHKLLYLEV